MASNQVRLLYIIIRYINIQSLPILAAGAVWLNLGPPRQPNGRSVYHHGTETRFEQANLDKIELEEKPLDSKNRQKPSLRLQPCEIANISHRAEICNIAWLESAASVLAKQVQVQRSRVHVRSQNLATFVRRSDWSVPWLQTRDL